MDAIVTIDEAGTVSTFSAAAERMFGYQAREVIGRNVRMLMPEPFRSEHDDHLERYAATGEAHVVGYGRETVGQRRDGTTFPIHLAIGEMRVDTAAPRNLKLNFTVTAGQYAGGGLIFDSCVNAAGFNAVQFTAAITMGSLTGCILQVQVQTQDERPSTATMPSGGTCNSSTTTCYQYPAFQITPAPPATPMQYSVPFTMFAGGTNAAVRTQVVGLQWQANSMSGTGTCTFELRIDDIKFM